MRLGRRTAAVFAATASIALVAATAPGATASAGAASTTLSAIDLDVTTPAGSAGLGVLDVTTFASNAVDEALTPKGGPWARSSITPLTGPGGPVGEAEARSDGETSTTVSGSALEGIGGPVAGLSASVSPVVLEALASAERATATVDTVTAEVLALAGALGITVDATGIASQVDATGATAAQGLRVAGIDVRLGDLLPAEVLGQLPLTDLLALLEALPTGLPADVQGTVDDLRAAIGDVEDRLAAVEAAGAALDDPLLRLAALNDGRETVEELVRLLDEMGAIDPNSVDAGEALQGISDGLGSITDSVDGIVGGTVDGLTASRTAQATSASDCLSDLTGDLAQVGAEGEACIADLLRDTVSALTGTAPQDVDLDDPLAPIDGAIAGLLETVTVLADELIAAIAALPVSLDGVETAALDLESVLGQLDGLLGDAADTPLLSIGTITIGVNADSDGSEDGAKATVLCDPVDVTILAETFSTPSCAEGLEAIRGISATAEGALDTIAGVLNTLPLEGLVTVDDLEAGLFTDLRQEVTRDGEIVTAVAGITALDLQLPSITIDPAPVTDLLSELGLPDVLGTVQAVLDEAIAAIDPVVGLGLGTVRDSLVTVRSSLADAGNLGPILDQLDALIAGLDLGELGTLDRFTTPSVALRVDPVSTAAFAPGTKSPVGAPEQPASPEQPSLPATGGGAALLGLLAMGGAAGLMRRR